MHCFYLMTFKLEPRYLWILVSVWTDTQCVPRTEPPADTEVRSVLGTIIDNIIYYSTRVFESELKVYVGAPV